MLEGHTANHMRWQEQEIQELRRLYGDAKKQQEKLEEKNEKLKKVIEYLRKRLLEASKK